MEGLDSGGQGPTSGCCAIEEEGWVFLCYYVVPKYVDVGVIIFNMQRTYTYYYYC
jgi:hypothetical protein